MDIDELIFITYNLVNEYIVESITIEDEPWLESDVLRIINSNLGINFYQFILFLTQCIDKLVFKRIKQDANIVTVLKYKDRFQLLARKIKDYLQEK